MVHFFLAQGTICAAMHLSVTAAIIYGLMKNREGSRRTNRMIDKIIMYVHPPLCIYELMRRITLEGQIPGTIMYVPTPTPRDDKSAIIAILLAATNLGNPFIPWVLYVPK
jgi:hypothetical protein